MMGYEKLWDVMTEKMQYTWKNLTEEDGIIAAELEVEFAEMDGWSAESDAAQLLEGLGILSSLHYSLMSELDNSQK